MRVWILFTAVLLAVAAVDAAPEPTTIRERVGERIRNKAGVPAGEFFDSDGVKIHYTVEGEGDPVLLVHGFTASANTNWRLPGVTKMLAAKYKVIALDNRGHGESDKPEAEGMYGVKMVEDSIRLLDHLKIQKAHWVGYSMGGMITMKALAMHPDRIKSAIVGGMGWMPERGPEAVRIRRPGEPEEETSAQRACFKGFAEMTLKREELLAVKIPVTVIVGANDQLLDRYVKPLQEARPDVPVTIVPDATHMSCIMKPEFKTAISAFLDAQSGAK